MEERVELRERVMRLQQPATRWPSRWPVSRSKRLTGPMKPGSGGVLP